MTREQSSQGRGGRRWLVLAVLGTAIVAAAIGGAWTHRREFLVLAQYLRPVDGRQRIGADQVDFNVLILVLDACRADKLSAYGFERETTPTIAALARDPDAVVFRRHYANGNWTKTSTASLFTGMFAHEHGVFRAWRPAKPGHGERSFSTQVLSDRVETMAEMFSQENYYTFAIVQGHHLDPEFGFAQGFDEYYTNTEIWSERVRVRATNALLRDIKGGFFGYVHPVACHQPFPPNARHAGYMDRYGFDYPEDKRIAAGVNFRTTEIKKAINDGERKLTEDDVRFLNLVYEARTRRMDENLVRPILETLKESGRYDNTLIVVTADHGEALYDHGTYAHAELFLWEEVIHVPLIVKFPKAMRPKALGPEVTALTSAIDLMPTLAVLLGREPPAHARGAAIFQGAFADQVFVEGHQCEDAGGGCAGSWALLAGKHKLIEYPNETLLFDLEADPGERRSIGTERPHAVAALRAHAAGLRRGSSTEFFALPVETEISEDAVKALRGLGYIE